MDQECKGTASLSEHCQPEGLGTTAAAGSGWLAGSTAPHRIGWSEAWRGMASIICSCKNEMVAQGKLLGRVKGTGGGVRGHATQVRGAAGSSSNPNP